MTYESNVTIVNQTNECFFLTEWAVRGVDFDRDPVGLLGTNSFVLMRPNDVPELTFRYDKALSLEFSYVFNRPSDKNVNNISHLKIMIDVDESNEPIFSYNFSGNLDLAVYQVKGQGNSVTINLSDLH